MPTEVHETFDPDGVLLTRTVITRESEWDDESRGRAFRLAEYESSICPCGCGLPMKVSHDKQIFQVDKVTCYAGRAARMARRQADDKAREAKTPDGYDDGVMYIARPPTEEELRAH